MMKKTVKSLIFAAVVALVLTLGMALIASAADVLDGTFNSTEGTLNWAYLENGGKLEATGNTYEANTLIIYGSGTSYTYSKSSIGSATDATSAFPWGSYRESIKHIVVEAPNLTTVKSFSYIANLETVVIPASVNTLSDGYHVFSHCRYLRSVTVSGVDYSAFGENANIFDFRNISKIRSNSLRYVAEYIDDTKLTVLFGENTALDSTGSNYFFNGHGGTIDVYVYEGSTGETLLGKFTSSQYCAEVSKIYYPEVEVVDPSTLNKALTFEGYQVRTKVQPTNADASKNAENGLRTLYYCDNTVVNEGFTLTEYGTILSTKANAEYAVLDSVSLETSHEKVVKSAVYENGVKVGLTLKSDDESKERFATTLINIAESNYSTEICVRGYEVWTKDGTNYVLYSDSNVGEEVYYPSLSDVTVSCFANGLINSADQDENKILWKVLDTCRVELTEGTMQYGSETKTRIYALVDNVITVSESSTDPNFASNDTTIHVFESVNDGFVAIVRGTGKAYRTTEMLKSCCSAAVETIVYDDGLTSFGFGDFKNNSDVKYVVYPDTLVGTGTEVFNKAPGITAVSKVKTTRVSGIIDLRYLDGVGFSSSSYLFAGTSSNKKENIEYIYLPKVVADKAITLANDFTYIPNLKAVWCVGNTMTEGKANFEGTNIIGDEKAFANSGISTENIIWGAEPVVEETPAE